MRLTRNCTSNSLMSLSVVSLAWPGSGLKGLIRFLPNPLHAYPLLGFPPFLLCTYALDSTLAFAQKRSLSLSLPTHSNKILLWLVITFLFLLIRPLREGVLLRWSARAREKSSPLPKLLLLCFLFLVPVFFLLYSFYVPMVFVFMSWQIRCWSLHSPSHTYMAPLFCVYLV